METKPIYIPFLGIFPALATFHSKREGFKSHFPKINQETLYGKTHLGAVAIDKQIRDLHLLMHRLRTDLGVSLRPEEKYNVEFRYLSIDFDSFFIWLRMIMDSVAFLTPLFYEKGSDIPTGPFGTQRDWFAKDKSNLDLEYTKYLANNMSWYKKMKDTRDKTIHKLFWGYPEFDPEDVKFKRMKGNRVREEINSIAKVIGEYYQNFLEFAEFYDTHFVEVLKTRDKSFVYKGQEAYMSGPFYDSISYFIKKAKV